MSFPAVILDLKADLRLAGTWTDISTYVFSERAKPQITRGRADEASEATASAAAFQLDNRDSRFATHNPVSPYYPNLTRNTPFRLHVPEGTTYLRLEDDSTSSCSTPSAAGLNLAGDLEARIDLNLSSGISSILAAKASAGGQFSWAWGLNADGTLFFQYSPDGSTNVFSVASSAPLPWPAGRISLKLTF